MESGIFASLRVKNNYDNDKREMKKNVDNL